LFQVFLGRNFFEKNKYLKALDFALESDGKKLSFLLRLTSYIPLVFLNFILPNSKISFSNYQFGFLAIIIWSFIDNLSGSYIINVPDIFNQNSSFCIII